MLGRAFDVAVPLDDNRSTYVAEVRPRDTSPVALGDVFLAPNRPATPTLQDRVLKQFSAAARPLKGYFAALALAGESRQRVLLVFADPLASATQNLMQASEEDAPLAAALERYRVVLVDVAGKSADQGAKFARSRGLDLAAFALPALYICNDQGERLAVADRAELMPLGVADTEKLLRFLAKYALEKSDPE